MEELDVAAPPAPRPAQAGSAAVPARPQTIAIAVDQGFAARYLLRTDILPTLEAAGATLVILTPNADEAYFLREFAGERVFVEPLDVGAFARYSQGKLQRILRNLRFYVMNGRMNIHAVDLRFQLYRQSRRKDRLALRLYNPVFDLGVWLLRRSRLLRRALIRLESALFKPSPHRRIFERYRPDKLLITSLGFLGYDHYLIREARTHGTTVVSVILSWDNTSTKGMPGAIPDRVVAWTDRMRDELVGYSDTDPRRIFVGGIAHFDQHYGRRGHWSREQLCSRLGLDPGRRLLVFGTRSPNKFPWNPDIVRVLARAIVDGRLAKPCQLLVRVHPVYFRTVDVEGRLRFVESLEKLLAVAKEHPHVAVDLPEILSRRLPMDMPRHEMAKIGSILQHADVVISYFSTLMIEAAIYDRPIVNVALHPHVDGMSAGDLRVVRNPHIDSVLATGGVRTAFTEDELIGHVNAYLEDPALDAEGRRKILAIHGSPFPLDAGRRIAEHILSL